MNHTQHDKIVELCKDGEYHCQIEFWNLFIRSPHKRRAELKERGYEFETRNCEHGVRNGFDYRMHATFSTSNPPSEPQRAIQVSFL